MSETKPLLLIGVDGGTWRASLVSVHPSGVQAIEHRTMTLEHLLQIVRCLPEEDRKQVAEAAGVSCWHPWHRMGF